MSSVVRKINTYQQVLTKLPVESITWETIATTILRVGTGDAEEDRRIRAAFTRLWQRFANDFLNEMSSYEYNSLKHGLRVSMGGSYFAMGLEDTPGVPAAPEKMHVVSNSTFGTSFYVSETLIKPHHFRVKKQHVNWDPTKFVDR